MSWMDVLKYMVLLFGVMCVVCVAISMNNDGKATVEFIRQWRRYPTKTEQNPDAKK